MHRRKFFEFLGGGAAAAAVSGCVPVTVGDLAVDTDEQSDREFVIAYLRKRLDAVDKRNPRGGLEVDRWMEDDFNICLKIRGDGLWLHSAQSVVKG